MLTDKQVKAAKARDKPYKMADGRGLLLVVDPRGGKYWRYRYRFAGKEKQVSLGTYPDVSLKRAREKLNDERKLVADHKDPSVERQAAKVARVAASTTFADVAEEYFALHESKLSKSTKVRDRRILDKLVARVGRRPLAEIETPELLAALREIESDGAHETAHRALGLATRVYEYAIACGKATRTPAAGLRAALAPVVTESHAAITDPREFGALLRAIDNYSGQPATVAALKLLPILFTRPGELRLAQWREFDLDGKEPQWVIPAARTKVRRDHVVPLPKQAVRILTELRPISERGPDSLVFPSLRPGRPLSENTLNLALRNLGYSGDQHTSHGFRSSASTLMHEMGFDSMLIELQLAHVDRNKVRAVYNRAERLADRRKMMQAWADYVDALRTDAEGKVRALRA